MTDLTEREALAHLLWSDDLLDMGGLTERDSRRLADTVLASDWLAERLATAWDEGHRAPQRRGPDNCQCSAWSEGECACGEYGTGALISLKNNPYRDNS